MQDKKVMALYIRLSDEDGDIGDSAGKQESNSVTNQRKLLQEYYAGHPGLHKYELREFCDDGYSGTNFDRPGFQAMMAQVRQKTVGCIMVKDLSRFGREYLEVSSYLELILPLFGTRFISVNDSFDSADYAGTTGGIELALRNLINGLYSVDLSKKIRSAVKTRNRQGKYWGGWGFYGYLPNPADKHRLVVDENVRPVVEKIFTLCIEGSSTTQIACQLNKEGIPCPAVYKRQNGLGYNGKIMEDGPVWLRGTVRKILNDERYTGKMITGTRESEGMRCNKMKKLPQEEWTVIERAHEPIITEETFQQAKAAMQSRIRTVNQNTVGSRKENLFVCGFCGRKLQKSGGRVIHLVCPKARILPDTPCANVYVELGQLQEKTLQVVRVMAKALLEQSEKHGMTAASESGKLESEITQLQHQIKHLQNSKFELYEDYRSGKLTKERFMEIQRGNQLKTEGLGREAESKKKQLDQLQENSQQIAGRLQPAEEVWILTNYRPEIICKLVEVVKVFGDGRIELEMKFRDIFAGLEIKI